MNRLRTLIAFLLLLSTIASAQTAKRLQPGKVYGPGEAIYSPRFGFRTIIPNDWSGVLPRESEVFLLGSLTLPAEIYVFGRTSGNLESIKSGWEKGVEIENSIRLQ